MHGERAGLPGTAGFQSFDVAVRRESWIGLALCQGHFPTDWHKSVLTTASDGFGMESLRHISGKVINSESK